MSIITRIDERASWLATVSALTIQIQRLETHISIAMLDRPAGHQARALMQADQQLGVAAKALLEAAAAIRGMR